MTGSGYVFHFNGLGGFFLPSGRKELKVDLLASDNCPRGSSLHCILVFYFFLSAARHLAVRSTWCMQSYISVACLWQVDLFPELASSITRHTKFCITSSSNFPLCGINKCLLLCLLLLLLLLRISIITNVLHYCHLQFFSVHTLDSKRQSVRPRTKHPSCPVVIQLILLFQMHFFLTWINIKRQKALF